MQIFSKMRPASMSLGVVVLFFAPLVLVLSSDAQWAQWGGPNRDFKSPAIELGQEWQDGGPKILWRRELGEGNSAISVDDSVLYTMY